MNIYVGNLSYDATEEQLQELFTPHGAVQSASIIMDRATGRSRGFGFVEMPDDAQAQAAIDALNQKEFNGRMLTVNQAQPRENRPRRPSGGGSGGFRGGRGGGGYRGSSGGAGGR
jgi:cold-inducible RNA-binding protein